MKVMMNTIGAYSSPKQNQINPQRPLFKGNPYTAATDALAGGFAKIAKNKKMVELLKSFDKHHMFRWLSATTGVVISGFYMYNTAKSKKIEPEQKKPLMVNMGLVTALATTAGIIADTAVDKRIKNYQEFFKQKNPQMDTKTLDSCVTGIRGAATLLIFTMIYRYIAPVVVTPIANKISNHFFGKNDADKKSA